MRGLGWTAVGGLAALASGRLHAEPACCTGSQTEAAGRTGTAWAIGIDAMEYNPARLAESTGRSFTLLPQSAVGYEITSDLVAALDEVNDTVEYGFTTGSLESFILGLPGGGAPAESDVNALIDLIAVRLPHIFNDEVGIRIGAQARAGFHWDHNAIALSHCFLTAGRPWLDDAPEHLALFTAGTPSANASRVLGSGGDYTSAFARPESQALADRIADGGLLTQEQAEWLVYRVEQSGANPADRDVRRLVEGFAEGFRHVDGDFPGILSNRSGLEIRAVSLTQLGVARGIPLGGGWSIGGNINLTHAITYEERIGLIDPDLDNRSLLTNLLRRIGGRSGFNADIDAGANWKPIEAFEMGLSGQDLNQPGFRYRSGSLLRFWPRVRGGMALRPVPWLRFASDLDLIEHRQDALRQLRTRELGLGLSWLPLEAVAITAGWRKDLTEGSIGSIWSGGLRVEFGPVRVALVGAMGGERVPVGVRSGSQLGKVLRYPSAGQAGLEVAWVERRE